MEQLVAKLESSLQSRRINCKKPIEEWIGNWKNSFNIMKDSPLIDK